MGLLECGICGGNLIVAGSGKRKRYYCADNKQKGAAICPGMPGLSHKAAERLVLDGLRDELMRDEAYAAFRAKFDRHIAATEGKAEAELRRYDKAICERESAKENILTMIESGRQSHALLDRLDKIDGDLAEFRDAREAAPARRPARGSAGALPCVYR